MRAYGLHPDLERLIRRATMLDRAVLLAFVLLHMALSFVWISATKEGKLFSLITMTVMVFSCFALYGAVFALPLTRALRAARLKKLVVLLENAQSCTACGHSLGAVSVNDRCVECNRMRAEAFGYNLERCLRLVASGVRPQLVRVWARLARESGHSGVDQLIADVRLPRRPFRISYLLASALSIGMIVLVFALMDVSEAASRAVAIVAIPVVVVSFLAAFLTSRAAGLEMIGTLLFDDETAPPLK